MLNRNRTVATVSPFKDKKAGKIKNGHKRQSKDLPLDKVCGNQPCIPTTCVTSHQNGAVALSLTSVHGAGWFPKGKMVFCHSHTWPGMGQLGLGCKPLHYILLLQQVPDAWAGPAAKGSAAAKSQYYRIVNAK